MGQSPDSSSYNTDGIGVPLVQGNADIQDRTTKPQRYTSLPSSKYCDVGDTLISVRAPVGSISKSIVHACIGRGIASLGKIDNFLYQFFLLKENSWGNIAQGSTFSCITAKDIENLIIGIPTVEERNKIGSFLALIDERIQTQNKIIEDLFLLKKSITHNVFNNSSSEKIKLCNLIDISTGKRDANESDEHGIYPFFTCGKETLKINKYSFEGESLLISGNGEIGQVKYYSGKFDAYQRTYVLQNSKSPILYLKAYLEFILPMIVEREKQQSAMPYIVLGTLKNIDVPILDMNKTNNIISTFKAIDKKIERENKYKELLNKEKRYLLSNLFI